MTSPRHARAAWAALVVASGLVLLAAALLTAGAVERERRAAAEGAQRELDQRLGLALWRMETVAAEIVAVAAARPWTAWNPPPTAEGTDPAAARGGAMTRSLALEPTPSLERLHFLLRRGVVEDAAASYALRSPSVPEAAARESVGLVVREGAALGREAASGDAAGDGTGDETRTDPLPASAAGLSPEAVRQERRLTEFREKHAAALARLAPELPLDAGLPLAPVAEAAPARGPARSFARLGASPPGDGDDASLATAASAASAADVFADVAAVSPNVNEQTAMRSERGDETAPAYEVFEAAEADAASAGPENPSPDGPAAASPDPAEALARGLSAAPPTEQQVEYDNRTRIAQVNAYANLTAQSAFKPEADVASPAGPADVRVGPLVPRWLAFEPEPTLALLRAVDIGGERTVQGLLLDWNALRTRLVTASASPALGLRLAPAREPAPAAWQNRLATLPVEVWPAAAAPAGALSPAFVRALVFGWLGLAAACAAIAAVLARTLALSNRRAAFARAVAHELRTPLTSLRLSADILGRLLRDEPAASPSHRAAGAVQEQALRLSQVVDALLADAGLSADAGEGSAGQVGLAAGELLRQVAEAVRPIAEGAGLRVVVEGAALDGAGSPAAVRTSPAAVLRVFGNLATNTVRHATPPATCVHLRAAWRGRWLEITYADDGPGLPPGAWGSARGLGLPLSRRLARLAGGRLAWVGPGRGAAFRLRLPGVRGGGPGRRGGGRRTIGGRSGADAGRRGFYTSPHPAGPNVPRPGR